MPPRCGICAFGTAPAVTSTAAFALLFGPERPEQVWQQCVARASKHAEPGLSSYCSKCRRVTFLVDSRNTAEALVQHELDWREWVSGQDSPRKVGQE